MILYRVLEGAAGLGVIALVLSDVFRSVVIPRAVPRTLRFAPWLGRLILHVARHWSARWSRPARHNFLGGIGPFLIVLELLIWVAMLVGGFGLVNHALRTGFHTVPDFSDSVYIAVSSLLTLGLGTQDAVTLPTRFAVGMAALCGYGVITLTITFLLAIQGALTQRELLVLRLAERAGRPPSALAILELYARLGRERDQALVEFFQDWDAWSAAVLLTHRAFPILAYFRSTDDDCEWLAALGAVLDAAALVAAMRHDAAAEHAVLCHRMGTRLVRDLTRMFNCRPTSDTMLDRGQFADVHARLRDLGYPAGEGEGAWDAFRRFRAAHASPLRCLDDRFGLQPARW